MKVLACLALLLALAYGQEFELPPIDIDGFEMPPPGDIDDLIDGLGGGDLTDVDLSEIFGGDNGGDFGPDGGDFLPPPYCSIAADVLFVVDSSTTIGPENFGLVKNFVREIAAGLDVSGDLSRVSLIRYTSWGDSRFFFNTFDDKLQIMQAIDDTPYYGRGTMTGKALKVAHSHHLQPYNGWRGNNPVPTAVVVLTDSITQDPAAVLLNARLIHSKATRVIAVGVGPDANVVELQSIATAADDVLLLDDFFQLNGEISTILDKICEMEGDVNECLSSDTNNCQQVCSNTMSGFFCECFPGYNIIDDANCENINECAVDNGGCSHTCTDTDGSFVCSCPEGMVVAGNGLTCVADSCYGGNACAQICTNIMDGEYFCSCAAGYMLADDGLNCVDVDECAFNNGGCAHNCANVDGGFVCSCNSGFQLREDGASCGLVCYTCIDAASNEECTNTTVCQGNEQSCQTETRWEEGLLRISKRCKQTEACVNNFVQNPRAAWSPTQCTEEGGLSVCRCCCHHGLCNNEGDCDGSVIDIACPAIDTIPRAVGTALDCTGTRPGDVCDVICPAGYGPVNGTTQIVCTHIPGTYTADWDGVGEECVDIDECATNNGGCSHICVNTVGGYECACPDGNPCSEQKNDIYFIVDSSSSVGADNFDLMLNFVVNAISTGAPVMGAAGIQVGLMTYNKGTAARFVFNDIASLEDLSLAVDAIEYGGSGTRTAAAVNFAVDSQVGAAQGRRAGVPLSVIVLTDGRSQDSADIPAAAAKLYGVADNVQIFGIGSNVDYTELVDLANGYRSHVHMVAGFADLATLEISTCPEPEGTYYLSGDNHTCDFNECEVDNGGCSDICINTIGGRDCACSLETHALAEDMATCVPNACLNNNGGCAQGCMNSLAGAVCYCYAGFVLNADGVNCDDLNECLDDNGGCSDGCVNTAPGRYCTCPEGYTLDTDAATCIPDSCYNPTFACSHTCINIPGVYGIEGEFGYICQCDAGYFLELDGHNCTEIDECAFNNGGCEDTCVNTDGGFYCACPEGYVLRADGKTCAIICHTCVNALSNEECSDTVECPYGADSCFATMRTRDNATLITKGCQQTLACINNMIQNPRSMGEGPSQCNLNAKNVKCECCCFDSYCNAGSCPYETNLPGCPAFVREDVQLRGLQPSNSEVLPGGMAVLVCPAGYAASLGGAGKEALNCVYDWANNTATWDGTPDELDSCVDVNECAVNNGGCVAPASCLNFPGGYECVCPNDHDDYQLIDFVICERDECADLDQGGCSHNCTNTIGGYQCYCPGEMSLVRDGLTCNFDECRDNNGGCAEVCINTLAGNECGCFDAGYAVGPDGVTCVNINECAVDNGGCEVLCNDLPGSYECGCLEGDRLNEDGKTCRPDPCYPDNGGCQQLCLVDGEGFVCACSPGYANVNGTCVDINECAVNNGGCSHNCTNFDGGFECWCPPGLALDTDLRTCGRACIECFGAETNEECNAQGYRVCPPDSDACENEVRVHGGKKYIFKQCKQKKACYNNFIQNPREAWLPTQCNGGSINDVCRCCCDGHMCNSAERPCAAASECHIQEADVLIILDSSSSVKYNNFQKVKGFTKALVSSFALGQGKVHTAMMRYNKANMVITTFNDNNALDEALDAIDNTPYDGSGTRTGAAIQFAVDNLLTAAAGRRADVPLIAVVLTDGASQDDVGPASDNLAATGASVIAIGIGNVDQEEVNRISSTAIFGSTFDELEGDVLDQITALACADVNECETDNGGCSDLCINTGGSYYCDCSAPGMALDADLKTCVPADTVVNINECAILNGGCSHGCEDTLAGYNCTCPAGLALSGDGFTCFDVNECAAGPCSHGCANTHGGFFCECPPTHYLADDGLNCAARVSVADCGAGFSPAGHSCVQLIATASNYGAAAAACAGLGGRLAAVSSEGAAANVAALVGAGSAWVGLSNQDGAGWVNSDGAASYFNVSGAGACAAASANAIAAASCDAELAFVCEQTRAAGFVQFSRTWNTGAQGVLYFPTGADTATINFPARVGSIVAWHCSVVSKTSASVTVSQSAIEAVSGGGSCHFVIDFMATAFADYLVTVA